MSLALRRPAALAAALLALVPASSAQTPLTTELVAGGLARPVEAVSMPGDARIFIVEQNTGLIKIHDGTSVLATPYLDLGGKIKSSGNEEGLLGIAFHPDYANNGYFYVNYTASNPNRTVVERYTVSAANPNRATPGSGFQILSYTQPFSNHNGGCLRFGPDGYLYIGSGDGGSAGDPQCNAQNPLSMLGKMLRIDVDGGTPYAVPASNPWVGTAGVLPELWAVGLRNPWRYSFDALTGDLYIGDVGQGQREEVDVAPLGVGGLNFGWKIMEGLNCYSTVACPPGQVPVCNDAALTLPITQYTHSGAFGGHCSITGGEVYRGCKIPDLFGTYFYADYCSNKIYTFELVGGVLTNPKDRTAELAPGAGLSINSISSFGHDGDGDLLICDLGGEVYRVKAKVPPVISDCDQNGYDDGCEIALDPSLDANQNGVLDACEPTCGYTQYGLGASAINSMGLAGIGAGAVGTTATIQSTGAPSAVTAILLSGGQASFPIFGGVGLIDPLLLGLTAILPSAAGSATWNLGIPNDVSYAGAGVYFQAASPDALQPQGWVLSNGLELIICP